jgi:hypothetical protein
MISQSTREGRVGAASPPGEHSVASLGRLAGPKPSLLFAPLRFDIFEAFWHDSTAGTEQR